MAEGGDGDVPTVFEGQLVETIGPDATRGMVVDWEEDTGKPIIETFDAERITVSAESLRAYEPKRTEEGGFDLAWPCIPEGSADFVVSVVELLRTQDYCVVQMFVGEETRAKAIREARPDKLKYKRMRKDFERAYLGRQHKCKTAWLEGLAEEKEEESSSALDTFDTYFSQLTRMMLPIAPCALGFSPYSRTNTMVRVPFESAVEEARLRAEDVNDDDIDEGLVDSHIDFCKRRKICMMLFVDNAGGDVTLIPQDDNQPKVVIEAVRGRMLIFRHERMSYMYNPLSSTDLVVQAWVLSHPDQLAFMQVQGDQQSKDEAYGIVTGPSTPIGMRTNVQGMSPAFGGGSHMGMDSYWVALAAGTDGYVKVPYTRWDGDLYYKDVHEWTMGSTYTYHGSFVCEDIFAFDNEFFGVSTQEAYILSPSHRQILEKAYDCLFKSGYKKETLKAKKIGIFIGHSGDDWECSPIYTLGDQDMHRFGFQARAWGTMAGRIAFVLGLKGPQALIDTACSSALVAYGVGHTQMRQQEYGQAGFGFDNKLNESVMMGVNLMPGPGNYIGLCGPHMLSPGGRCFTFDHSADGFERGEGTGAFFVRNEESLSSLSFATVIGACLNQDGRSASMTAPNGPSQQDCIRGSMREAGLTANQVTCAECHGTGTALGDPIEVGALRGVMQDRVVPLLETSAKTHIGHMEACAGQGGMIKCILMCLACTGTPNCHLMVLNPHLDVNGYPTVFDTELVDYGGNSGYSGVSSFGFGGANARSDVFASAQKGPRRMGELNLEKLDYITIQCPFDEGPMHYLDGRAVPLANSRRYKHGRYHANAIRDEFASYDYNSSLYTGKYQLNPSDEPYDEAPRDPIYIVGTWDGFSEPREMEDGDKDTWTVLIELGETRFEMFQLRVDKDVYRAIHPVVRNGSTRTRVVGPSYEGAGLYWLLDGRDDEVPAGTVYRITLTWGERPAVRWEISNDPAPEWTRHHKHTYQVLGSWTAWQPSDMRDVSDEENPNTWETKVKIGMSHQETFRFMRDRDTSQVIYPSKQNGIDNAPACGPDSWCNEKNWRVSGSSGEVMTLRLQVVNGQVTVKIASRSNFITSKSLPGVRRHTFFVQGSFNDWANDEMTPDESRPGVYRYRNYVGPSGQELFSIIVDADPGLVIFPEAPCCYPGLSIVKGPDAANSPTPADGRMFHVTALKVGAEFEIILDFTAPDKRKVVDIEWITPRFDVDSLKETYWNFFGEQQYALGW